MATSFAPHLFVKNISKNITKQTLWNVFNNYGFGVIDNIFIKNRNEKNNAIVIYKKWYMEETIATRMLLESGKKLTITCEEWNEAWKVGAYNKNIDIYMNICLWIKIHQLNKPEKEVLKSYKTIQIKSKKI